VYKCWAVSFIQNVWSNLNHIVRTDTHEVVVKRSVMQLAEREAIRDHWLSLRLTVGYNVRRVEELLMTEAAEGA
jgi:hypothetical protein